MRGGTMCFSRSSTVKSLPAGQQWSAANLPALPKADFGLRYITRKILQTSFILGNFFWLV